nr:anaphase-promoting complex subunit 7 [Tanacetum cinerariifolium]
GCFLVSSSSVSNETSPHLKAEYLALHGDALLRDKEYRRAIHVYKQALQYHKIVPRVNSTTRSSLSAMEAIPSKARNLQMNLLMGKLYRYSKHIRPCITCYKECLRHCPYVIEAITALAELGVQAKDIFLLLPQTPSRSGRPPFDQFESSRWLQRYVEAQCCIASNDYKGGLELFSELLQRFPNNVRSIDPYVVTYMDEYAMLLKLKSDLPKLNKLVHDLLTIDPARPEVFVALSVLWERKDDRAALTNVEKAKKFYESALRLEPGYLGAALALAELHVMEGRNYEAVTLLERYLKDWADDSLHVKLAQVFAATNMMQDSLSHYQSALRINPLNEAAKKGLERLEKLMKGVDPDAPEEEDNDVDDGDGDPEEAELL